MSIFYGIYSLQKREHPAFIPMKMDPNENTADTIDIGTEIPK